MSHFLSSDDDEFVKSILGPDDDNDPLFTPSHSPVSIGHPKSPSNRQTANFESSSNPLKCVHLFLGGTSLTDGITVDSNDPHFCSNMFCISCDHLVIRIPNRRWKESTDYLFLRNNYPDTVKQNLIPAARWCAYCCQCTFCQEQELKKLPPFSTNWVCRGHR
jgi:hypothetical protein